MVIKKREKYHKSVRFGCSGLAQKMKTAQMYLDKGERMRKEGLHVLESEEECYSHVTLAPPLTVLLDERDDWATSTHGDCDELHASPQGYAKYLRWCNGKRSKSGFTIALTDGFNTWNHAEEDAGYVYLLQNLMKCKTVGALIRMLETSLKVWAKDLSAAAAGGGSCNPLV